MLGLGVTAFSLACVAVVLLLTAIYRKLSSIDTGLRKMNQSISSALSRLDNHEQRLTRLERLSA
jgi:hypothetical protein